MNRITQALVVSALLLLATDPATARTPIPVPQTYSVEGICAEFLYSTLSSLANFPGLETIADCGMGTCGIELKNVVCSKNFAVKEPAMTCEFDIEPSPGSIVTTTLDHRSSTVVSPLRRALVEIYGGYTTPGETVNIVRATSIICSASAVDHQMDDLAVEPSYRCAVTK